MRRILVLVAAAAALPACDASRGARRSLEAGDFAGAHRAYAAAEAAAGPGAPPSLSYDRALAALRAGELSDAESAAKRAAAGDDAEIAALAEFVRGNVAFERAVTAALQADAPEAEPFAWDVALAHAAAARTAWRRAATAGRRPGDGGDDAAARRNVERADLLAEELRAKKAAAEARRKKPQGPGPKDAPRPAPDERPPTTEDPPGTDAPASVAELPASEVLRILDRLEVKERERRALRAAERRARNGDVERDW